MGELGGWMEGKWLEVWMYDFMRVLVKIKR